MLEGLNKLSHLCIPIRVSMFIESWEPWSWSCSSFPGRNPGSQNPPLAGTRGPGGGYGWEAACGAVSGDADDGRRRRDGAGRERARDGADEGGRGRDFSRAPHHP